jgi:hypothetical protein
VSSDCQVSIDTRSFDMTSTPYGSGGPLP